MLYLALPILMALMPSQNLLQNPDFENGLMAWRPSSKQVVMEAAEIDGRKVAHIGVSAEDEPNWVQFQQQTTAAPGETYEARIETMGRDIRDGHGIVLSVNFYSAQGERLAFGDERAPIGATGWMTITARAVAPEGTVKVGLSFFLHGRGDAYFDNAALVRLVETPAAAPGPKGVTLTVTDEVVCESLIGIGAEDDGWTYNRNNAGRGFDAADAAQREARIEWMDPDVIRMFHWYHDWNPSLDMETFDWETDGMLSHYRTLDLYQRIGARVNICGAEWAVPEPWADPPKRIRAIGALMEHLIIDRGYTCIQDWTLSNEPNTTFAQQGGDFPTYVEMHRLARDEFARRGLNLNIVGSDDAMGASWFAACAADPTFYEVTDIFASHNYFRSHEMGLMPLFFRDRLAVLDAAAKQHGGPAKPFILAEFGFADERSKAPALNPLMEEYAYAMLSQTAAINGLNQGVAAFSFWCMHEVYYIHDDNPMMFGLWNYKDRDWSVRPVYHAAANLMRLTEAGDKVRRTLSSHPDSVSGACVSAPDGSRDTLFWVNPTDGDLPVTIDGFTPREIRVMTESTLEGDRACGVLVEKPESARFIAPPQSFGYALRE